MRWGHHLWLDVDPTHLRELPDIYPIGTTPFGWKTSALDALCWKRVYVQGVDRSTNLATEIRSLYDNLELIGTFTNPSNNNQVYRECDDSSIGFMTTPGRAGTIHLVNSCAEYPPLASWPTRGRDSNWQPTGDYCQVAWSLIQGPRYYVSNARPLELKNGSDVWTSGATGVPSGWNITTHNREVTNSEGDGFKVRWGGVNKATASPYWGYFASTAVDAASSTGGVWNGQTKEGQYLNAYVSNGDVIFRRASSSAPVGGWEFFGQVTSFADVQTVTFCVGKGTKRIWLNVARDTGGAVPEIWQGVSDDDGQTFGGFEKMGDGQFSYNTAGNDGSLLTLWYVADSGTTGPGTIHGAYRGPAETSFTPLTVKNSAGTAIKVRDERSFGNAVHMYDSIARWNLTLFPDGGSDFVTYYCADEIGWTWTLTP